MLFMWYRPALADFEPMAAEIQNQGVNDAKAFPGIVQKRGQSSRLIGIVLGYGRHKTTVAKKMLFAK